MTKQVSEVIELLSELCEDGGVPKNLKARFQGIITSLKAEKEQSICVNRAKHSLEEIGEDNNLAPYVRTQIWNVASMLEKC
ncbi:MAG: UPF0147 family protein [Nanoarchaeota archaeon]|nr:UPF0147 family protein [Nanoarchaeota archaeon]